MSTSERKHLETLNAYLARMAAGGITEFRLAIQHAEPRHYGTVGRVDGADVRFILHPLGQDGDTADFIAPMGKVTSPGMTSYEVDPIGHEGLTSAEWIRAVRERYHCTEQDEDAANLYDFFAEGYAVEEMGRVLERRAEERLRDWQTNWD